MKNVTITLDEQTAAWARQQAAEQQTSLSRFVGELLERSMRQSREYEHAMQSFLSRGPTKLTKRGGKLPSRESLYDRGRLR